MRCIAGKKIKSDSIIYTPDFIFSAVEEIKKKSPLEESKKVDLKKEVM